MKSGSDKFTFVKQTDPGCFRAIATGIGQSLCASEETGEARKALVNQRPGSMAAAPANEGFATRSSYAARSWRANSQEDMEPELEEEPGEVEPKGAVRGRGY